MEHGHWIAQIAGHTLVFNSDTLITLWGAMLFVIILALLATKNLDIVPSKLQLFFEGVLGFFWELADSLMGKKEGRKHIPLVASLFLFIVTANLMGQIPWKIIHLKEGEIASPTNDLNVTAALAIIVLVYYISAGLMKKKFKFIFHGFSPISIMMFFLELLDMVTRPLTLALRLFGNVFAGEMLIGTILGFCAAIVPIPFMFLELLVACVQALVFSMLALVYVTMAVNEE
ncbi:F0F1 ATP synthase subunit A [bacterium]|nr:F0F1 ATP synthase subunit A [bacterium]